MHLVSEFDFRHPGFYVGICPDNTRLWQWPLPDKQWMGESSLLSQHDRASFDAVGIDDRLRPVIPLLVVTASGSLSKSRVWNPAGRRRVLRGGRRARGGFRGAWQWRQWRGSRCRSLLCAAPHSETLDKDDEQTQQLKATHGRSRRAAHIACASCWLDAVSVADAQKTRPGWAGVAGVSPHARGLRRSHQ